MKRLVAVALLVLVSSACSGPRTPLEVGVKEIDTDVLIGPQRPQPVVALPPNTRPGPIGFPGFVQPPIDTNPPPSPPPPPVCPAADPLAPIARPAATAATKPPVARKYSYLNSGTWRLGERSGVFPALAVREVAGVENPAADGDFTFDVVIPDRAGGNTTTTYHVYPNQPTPADPDPGLYIEQVVTRVPGEEPETFTPTPSLLLLPFPAATGATWSARGVDPLTQTVQQFDAKIVSRDVVDACGTKLQAWRVEVTAGTTTSPTADLTFSAKLWIAPQYGGLILKDDVQQEGTARDEPAGPAVALTSTNRALIRSEPVYPS